MRDEAANGVERMFLDALSRDYALSTAQLRQIPATTAKRIYHVGRTGGASLLLRAFPLYNGAAKVLPEVAVLDFLERRNYPAPRIVANKYGAATTRCAGWEMVVTNYIEGSVLTSEPRVLFRLGALLGRLHALAIDDAPVPLPEARMLPRKELDWIRGELDDLHDRLPVRLQGRAAELRREIDGLDHLEDLPRRLIHNDAHLSNALTSPRGESVYIDWDGAGLGAPLIDVGFLLLNGALGSVYEPLAKQNPAHVEAIIQGYSRHRTLGQEELDKLRDAMKFRLLVFGVAGFVAAAKGTREHEPPHWWGKYQALGAVADRIAARFADT
jgi:Ser/Thr protein kinase RdoA (MazF antagonist)